MADAGRRSIRVEMMTRVEGEGALRVEIENDQVKTVQLCIFEPPRLFESVLRGRALEEVPDITARICGICPVAYQMSSTHALEAALGISITPEIRKLRRLLYCGEWIESHALHVYLLNAPDFMGFDGGISMAAEHPLEVRRGLQLKKHGNRLLEVLGGRAIHPINVAVGGFYRIPHRDEFTRLIPDFEWGLNAAVETVRWVAGFSFPELTRPYDMISLFHPDEYPFNEGQIKSIDGTIFPVKDYELRFDEFQEAHTTALQSLRAPSRTPYFLGPLARINLAREQLSPTAKRLADEIHLDTPCYNPFKSIIARALELVHCYEEALSILKEFRQFQPHRVAYHHQASEGCWATEAPRGLLYHRYRVDDAGHVQFAKIVPPTSQNQLQIEDDLRNYIPGLLHLTDDEIATHCEKLVRTYDPCISCSTHFLKVQLSRK